MYSSLNFLRDSISLPARQWEKGGGILHLGYWTWLSDSVFHISAININIIISGGILDERKKNWKPYLIVLVAVILVITFSLVRQPHTQYDDPVTFNLQAPLFVTEARAEAGSVASFMEDEAGISCYYQASSSITLDDVSDAFRTIEVETSDYIIGSIPVSDYPESSDAHVYVHTDGWVVAYYLAADPVGKIFDWRAYDGTTIPIKLENTIAVVAGEAGVAYSTCTYYDFRYPNATKMMLVAEASGGIDSFEVNLPGTFGFFERSWSLGNGTDIVDLYLDGEKLAGTNSDYHTTQGTLTAAQLLPDTSHIFTVEALHDEAYGGLALVYREVP